MKISILESLFLQWYTIAMLNNVLFSNTAFYVLSTQNPVLPRSLSRLSSLCILHFPPPIMKKLSS
jgi:hypothetical protein